MEWLSHPVTAFLLETMANNVQTIQNIILDGEGVSLFNEQFLLREQLIGEQRGQRQAHLIVLEKRQQLIDSENPDHENKNNTIESDRE